MKCVKCGHSPKYIDLRINPWRCRHCGAFRLGLRKSFRKLWQNKHDEGLFTEPKRKTYALDFKFDEDDI